MNIKDIAALAEIVKQNELTKLEINGENIVIERAAQVVQAAPILNAVQPAVPEQMHTTEPIAEVKEDEVVFKAFLQNFRKVQLAAVCGV